MTAVIKVLEQPESDMESVTEDGIALAFASVYHDDFRFVPSLGWLAWSGTHWARDEKLRHFDVIRRMARNRVGDATAAPEERRLESARTIAAIASLARSDQRLVRGIEEFDRDPFLLNTPAGAVDLRDGTLHPPERGPFTKCAAVAPDFAASREFWHTFLRQIMVDDTEKVDFLRRLCGYFLTGDTREQILAFCHGGGSNGKSTLLDLVLYIMGDYGLKFPTSSLMAHAIPQHPTDVAQLRGARLAVSNEIEEGQHWAESRVKELTGDSRLTGRFMRCDYFTFDATHKHLIAGNHRPHVRVMDDAMRRRMVLIPFTAKFNAQNKDMNMAAKLRACAPAILADMIEGAVEWHRHGLLIPQSVRAASDEYADTMDSLGNWIAECCHVDPEVECKASVAYKSYTAWKVDRGEKPVSLTRFGEQMTARGIDKYPNNGVRYRGIDLTAEAFDRAQRFGAT